MAKQTLHDKLYSRKLHLPNRFLYGAIYHLGKLVFKKYNMTFNYIDDPRKEKGNIVMVANHANRNDFLFTAIPSYPKLFNYVAAYNEFFRTNLKDLFRIMQLVPKRQFFNDSYTVFEILSLVKKYNANICFYPEGLSGISGANQPITPGSGKLLKFLKLPVYACITQGAYLIYPKYVKFGAKERYAKTITTVSKIFTPEDLEKLSVSEIDQKLNEILFNDDYAWALKNNIHYKDNGYPIAKDLESLLYKCPKCGAEFKNVGEGNVIKCQACGNGASISDTYALTKLNKDDKIPITQTKWRNYQRIQIKKAIENDPNFTFEVETTISGLPKYRYVKPKENAIKEGEGKLVLSLKDGFKYIGTRNGENVILSVPNKELYTFCMSYDGDIIHFFYQGVLTQFTFKTKGMAAKILLTQQELHRASGGEWKALKDEYNEDLIFPKDE